MSSVDKFFMNLVNGKYTAFVIVDVRRDPRIKYWVKEKVKEGVLWATAGGGLFKISSEKHMNDYGWMLVTEENFHEYFP